MKKILILAILFMFGNIAVNAQSDGTFRLETKRVVIGNNEYDCKTIFDFDLSKEELTILCYCNTIESDNYSIINSKVKPDDDFGNILEFGIYSAKTLKSYQLIVLSENMITISPINIIKRKIDVDNMMLN